MNESCTWMRHVTDLNEACHIYEWVCMCAEGARGCAHSHTQHTYTYTCMHLHTGWSCMLGGVGGACDAEGVGQRELEICHYPIYECILSHVWMSPWAPGPMHSREKIQNRKKIIYICAYIWMSQGALEPMHQGTAKSTSHLHHPRTKLHISVRVFCSFSKETWVFRTRREPPKNALIALFSAEVRPTCS